MVGNVCNAVYVVYGDTNLWWNLHKGLIKSVCLVESKRIVFIYKKKSSIVMQFFNI